MPAASASTCRSGRCTRPTSRPTRKPASAITPIRISSTRCIAACAATARGSIRRCRTPPTPTSPMTTRWRSRPICSACRRCVRRRPPIRWRSRSTSAGRWRSGRRCSIRIPGSSPTRSKTPEWNRGAYLAEALAHCGECHTPRSLALGLDNRKKFAGALTAGWRAYNITSDKATGIGGWRDEDLIAYLSTGHATGHGSASGPMGEAVDHSFSQFPPEDIRAMVAYLRSVPADRVGRSAGDIGAAGAGVAQGGTRRAGSARQDGVRGRLRQLPWLDRREFDLALRHPHRRVGRQRSRPRPTSPRS